jgi:transposase
MRTKETTKKLKEITHAKKEEKRAKIYRRILAIEQRLHGKTYGEIAQELSVCVDTVFDWVKIYEEGGLAALRTLHYEGRRISKLKEYETEIRDHITTESVRTLEELQDWLQKTFSLEVEHSWLFRFCKKNSIFLSKRHA